MGRTKVSKSQGLTLVEMLMVALTVALVISILPSPCLSCAFSGGEGNWKGCFLSSEGAMKVWEVPFSFPETLPPSTSPPASFPAIA